MVDGWDRPAEDSCCFSHSCCSELQAPPRRRTEEDRRTNQLHLSSVFLLLP